MTDQDKELSSALRSTLSNTDGSVPSFERVWAAAEARTKRRRGKHLSGLAAGVVALLVVGVMKSGDEEARYVDVDELMGSTSWSAPSDSLMPERQFDIYQEVPRLFESTGTDGGTLL